MFYDAFIDELEKLALEGTPLSKTMRNIPWYVAGEARTGPMADPIAYIGGAETHGQLDARLRNLTDQSRHELAREIRQAKRRPKVKGDFPKHLESMRSAEIDNILLQEHQGSKRKFDKMLQVKRKQLDKAIMEKSKAHVGKHPRPEPKIKMKSVVGIGYAPGYPKAPGPTPSPAAPRPGPAPTASGPAPLPAPAAKPKGWFPKSTAGRAALIGIPVALGMGGIATYLLSRRKDKDPYEDVWEKEQKKTAEFLAKIARTRSIGDFGVRTTSRYPIRDIKRLGEKLRPKEYEHRDNSLADSEFIQTPAGSALGRMGRQDRGR